MQGNNILYKKNYALVKLEELGHDIEEFSLILFDETPKTIEFWKLFKQYKALLKKEKLDYDFSHMIFPEDPNNTLKKIKYKYNTDFSYCTFTDAVDFSDVVFDHEVHFTNTTFEDETNFKHCHFKKSTYFNEVMFEADTYFSYSVFYDSITFENSECKDIFDFSDTSFEKLILDKSNFPNASFLRLSGWNKILNDDIARENLSSKHFITKETARIIKAHFEKQNNIIESNIFYTIEMDKYREELTNDKSPILSFFTNQNYIVTTLSKYISNYGTSWIRAGIVTLFFAFLFSWIFYPNHNTLEDKEELYLQGLVFFWFAIYLISIIIDEEIRHRLKYRKVVMYLITFGLVSGVLVIFLYIHDFNLNSLISIHNYVAKVVNPFNIFKANDIFKDHESFGTIVRIVMLTLIYQFIVAFRQNTRRK